MCKKINIVEEVKSLIRKVRVCKKKIVKIVEKGKFCCEVKVLEKGKQKIVLAKIIYIISLRKKSLLAENKHISNLTNSNNLKQKT